MTRIVLAGEVRSAEFALRGMLAAGLPPVAVLTTDVVAVRATSAMAADYYADLPALARAHGLPCRVLPDAAALPPAVMELAPDYAFVVGWPYLVREPLLSAVPCIGMHPTRLPYRRGGAPLNWVILDGERESAVTLLRLRAGVDDGEILAQGTFPIAEDDYVNDALHRCYELTEALTRDAVRALAAGTARWIAQDEDAATYTRRRRPEDGRICWRDSAVRIRNLVRAVSRPFPGAFTSLDGTPLLIWRAEVPRGIRAPLKAEPGTILPSPRTDAGGILIATRDNALRVTEAQLGTGASLTGDALATALGDAAGRVLS